jgi:hypothetical protein
MPDAGDLVRASHVSDVLEDTTDAGITLSTSYQTTLSLVLPVGTWHVVGKVRFTAASGSATNVIFQAELHDGTAQLDESMVNLQGTTNQRGTVTCQDVVVVASSTTTVSLRVKVDTVAGTPAYNQPKLIATSHQT